jgi:hypothetical protein
MSRAAGGLLVLGLFAVLGWQSEAAQAPAKGKKAAKEPTPKNFTISKETTYVTGPRDKAGLIDYEAALNERLRKGVTPENNANVSLWKAFGPRPEGAAMPPGFFKWLGIPEPPEQGDYFIGLSRYLKEHARIKDPKRVSELADELERVAERPWRAKEHPLLAGWLKANGKPLALIVAATRRPRYFMPLVATRTGQGPSGLLNALLPSVQKCRECARALGARAMLRVAQGRTDKAWQDLLACHRLGRLVAQGGTLIEGLVGLAVDNMTGNADLALLERSNLNVKQIKARLGDLRKLPPMPPIADRVDLAERFFFLDTIMMINRRGIDYLGDMSGGRRLKAASQAERRLVENINWDPALRDANRWFDRLVAAMRVKDRVTREKQLHQIERELKQLKANTGGVGALFRAWRTEGTAARARGKAIGDVLVTLLIPAVQKVQQAYDRIEQVHRNVEVAFALAAYKRDHGHYPKALAALGPAYLQRVPNDLFSGKPLIYRPSAKGYLLYSVGVNGRDDGGRSYDDDPPADDLVVRMPLPPLPQPRR